MNKGVISDKQGIVLIIMFITGSSAIFIMGLEAKQNLWIAIILSIFMALPTILICARLYHIFLGKDLFDILDFCFCKFIAKVIGILYIWYFFHQVSDVLRNVSHFIITVGLVETPLVIPMISISILSIWIVKEGIKVISKWTEFFVLIYISLIIITILLLIPQMDIYNIRPIFDNSIKSVVKGAFLTFTFPFGEIIVFTMVFSTLKTKNSYKVYIYGMLISGMVIFAISVTSILVLGENIATSTYYPSFMAVTRINIGSVLQRMEVVAAIIFLLGVFVKVSIYLWAACKGVTKIFGYADYRFIVIPASLLTINLSYSLYDSIMAFFEWDLEIWPYYAFLFQVILPIIILIVAEVKKKYLIDGSSGLSSK